jgi:hypothetical protein
VPFDTIRHSKIPRRDKGAVVDFWRNFDNLFLKIHHLSGSQKKGRRQEIIPPPCLFMSPATALHPPAHILIRSGGCALRVKLKRVVLRHPVELFITCALKWSGYCA